MPMPPPAPPLFSTTTGWPEVARHGFGHRTADDVGQAAGRERHDHRDGLGGEGRLGGGEAGGGEKDRGEGGATVHREHLLGIALAC